MASSTTNFSIVLTENQDVQAEGAKLKSSFFTAAKSRGEVQPVALIDSQIGGNGYIVQCDMTKVVHGTLDQGGSSAMLAVFEFVLLPRGLTKRFLEAEIEIAFSEGQLAKIAPEGSWATLKSSTEREVTHTVNPSVEVGVDPVKTALGYTWELTERSNRVAYASIKGAKMHGKTTAFWGLSENTQVKSGLPSFLRTAVLLERPKKPAGVPDSFTATVTIRGVVDKLVDIEGQWEKVKRNISSREREGVKVKFDSSFNRGEVGDRNNMATEKLTAYQALVTVKSWEEAEAGKSPGGTISPSPPTDVTQPGSSMVGTKPIDLTRGTTLMARELESFSTSVAYPSSTPATVLDPSHEALVFPIDNVETAQAPRSPTTAGLYNPPQPSISAHSSLVAAMPGDDQQETTNNMGLSELLPRPTKGGLSGASAANDELATLQQQLASVRLEARLVHRLINLVDQERSLVKDINKLKARRILSPGL